MNAYTSTRAHEHIDDAASIIEERIQRRNDRDRHWERAETLRRKRRNETRESAAEIRAAMLEVYA